ncbi:MAG: transketolase C-terminal domain-containing protein [Candidatus Saccharimonadales bacterium]|nr:transketolase C-terminal domain-containing protein [Candidatus Saccharimonadales bacterium]
MSVGMYLVKDLDDTKQLPIRDGFGKGLVEAARMDDSVIALCADLTDSVRMNWFREEFPERFVQVGIAEQNLVAVASGMAAMGKKPFATSYAAFSPGRNWEQIKTTIALNERAVNIVGSHGGIMTGPDGATHQMLEDIAMMRVMPNMVVVCPADAIEAQKATMALAEDNRPSYIRLVRDATPVFTTNRTPFSLKRAYVLSPGNDVTIVSTGIMTYHALRAAEKLYSEGIDIEVLHMPVIKPLDGATLLRSAEKTGAVVTVEDAQIKGGLGGAVAEFLSEHKPTPIKRMGVKDRFGESGEPEKLLKHFGLTSDGIAKEVLALMTEQGRH